MELHIWDTLRKKSDWDLLDQSAVADELDRAHAEEDRLGKELAKKDAIIKALADAVELSGEYLDGDWHSSGCPGWDVRPGPCGESCARRRAALRLAGRLP